MQAHVTAATFAFSRTKGAFQFKNWKIQLEKYLWCDLPFRSTNKILPLLVATSTFLHNSQNWGTSLTSRATKSVKESQIQLRQLKSSLNSPFLHVRARCLVVQWNLIQVMAPAGCFKTPSLIWDDTEGSPTLIQCYFLSPCLFSCYSSTWSLQRT